MKNLWKKLLTFVVYHANILIVDTVNVIYTQSVTQIRNWKKKLDWKKSKKYFKKLLTKNDTFSIIQKHSEMRAKSTLKSKQWEIKETKRVFKENMKMFTFENKYYTVQ